MYYFAYGSNLNLRGMKRRCPKSTPACAATLAGYRLEFRKFATIVPDPSASVQGALYELTPACARALDKYEGPAFPRIPLTVETDNGPRAAFAYAMTEGEPSPPTPAYYTTVARGYADWKLDAAVLRRARLASVHPAKGKQKPTARARQGEPR